MRRVLMPLVIVPAALLLAAIAVLAVMAGMLGFVADGLARTAQSSPVPAVPLRSYILPKIPS
jgi:hypothetical protein